MPRALVVQNGEKTFSFRSGEIPLPLSFTVTTTPLACCLRGFVWRAKSDPRFGLTGGGFRGIGDEMGESLGQGGFVAQNCREIVRQRSCRSQRRLFLNAISRISIAFLTESRTSIGFKTSSDG